MFIVDSGCFQEKWEGEICVNFRNLNVARKKNPYPLPFMDEVINTDVRHEVYTIMDEFSRYH